MVLKNKRKGRSPVLCELWPSLWCLLLSNCPSRLCSPISTQPLQQRRPLSTLLPSLNRHTLRAALSGAIPFLNSWVLSQDHFCDSSYPPPACSEIHFYPSHPRFQVSYFGNIMAAKLPALCWETARKCCKPPPPPRALHICHSLVFLFTPGLRHPGKPWKAMEGLEESFLIDSQEDNVKVKQKWPFPEKEKAGETQHDSEA